MCFGGKTTIQQATPPAAPSVSSSITDYVNALPKLQQAELEYAPKSAAQDFELAQQYYPEYTKLMQQTEAGLYPETAALQESLAKKAREGMDAAIPESMRTAYLDTLRSEVGPNVGSGIAGDYVSRNLINLQHDYNRYYNDLGLSLTGRLPLQQTATPAFAKSAQGFDANSAMGFNQGNYGTAANMFSNQYANNLNYSTQRRAQNFGLIGAGLGTAGSFLKGGN